MHADEHAGDVVVRGRLEHGEPLLERRPAERRLHLLRVEAPVTDRERLVEQRQRVPGGTGGPAGDEVERLGIGLDALAAEDVGEMADELAVRQQGELEVLGARADRRQHLLRIGRREHEHDVGGRLLERLQQRVRRRRRQHVHLVDDVHLAPARRADAEMHALDELAHRLDAVVRRGVELDEVEERSRGDGLAVLAHAARLAVVAELEAVERVGRGCARSWSCRSRAARRRDRRARRGLHARRSAARS